MLFKKLINSFSKFYDMIMSRYKFVWTFSGIIYALIYSIRPLPSKVDYLFICHDAHRHSKKNGLNYAPLLDPIAEELTEKNYSCLTFAAPFSRLHGKNCFGDVRIYNSFIIIALIKRIIFTRSLTLKNIATDPLIFSYKKVLKKINPHSIIGIQPSIEICIAAKSLKIPIYDMQHGLISDTNYYNFNKRVHFNQEGWPTSILCWDYESSLRVKSLTQDHVNSLVIGNPAYHSRYGKEISKQVASKNYLLKYKTEILITLTYQDYYDKKNYLNNYGNNLFIQVGMTEQLADVIKQTPDIYWRIRMHPMQAKFDFAKVSSSLKDLFEGFSNIDWINYTNSSLGYALRGCIGHITIDSAAAIDAAQNSIPSILIGCPGWSDRNKVDKYFEEYISTNIMKYVEPDELSYETLDFFNLDITSLKTKRLESANNFNSFINSIIKSND